MTDLVNRFEIQGHRGCRGLLPENTIPGFLKALEENVDTLELDVVISGDRKVVVSHDPFFDPAISAAPDGSIPADTNLYLMDYEEIRRFDVGSRGNPAFPGQIPAPAYKPLLSEVFESVKTHGIKKDVRYNIEIKSLETAYHISQPDPGAFSDLVAEVIKPVTPSLISIQSFDFNVLRIWKQRIADRQYPAVQLAVLIEPEDNNDITDNLQNLGFQPDIWSPHYSQVTPERVQMLHDKGIRLIPWTVNDRKMMETMKSLGCDGLITDYPDRAKDL